MSSLKQRWDSGPNAPIHPFTRDEADGTREIFWKKLLKKGPNDAKANIVASNGTMRLGLAQDHQAIGYPGIEKSSFPERGFSTVTANIIASLQFQGVACI